MASALLLIGITLNLLISFFRSTAYAESIILMIIAQIVGSVGVACDNDRAISLGGSASVCVFIVCLIGLRGEDRAVFIFMSVVNLILALIIAYCLSDEESRESVKRGNKNEANREIWEVRRVKKSRSRGKK